MFKQGRKILLIAGALAAIRFGGTALAVAGAATKAPTATPKTMPQKHHKRLKAANTANAAEPATGADTDNVESGDQSGPDSGSQAADNETNDGAEQPGTETNDGQEQEGSEVANNDGPSGHADEPGNPNANNQE